MADARSSPILVAGAGIAGLTAALALARHGFAVRLFERYPALEEAGAGIQLSPNATRLLDRLGVLAPLRQSAATPEAVILRDAGTLRELARVPLGQAAEARWGAPYLATHRADLQRALLTRVEQEPAIELTTGAAVRGVSFDAAGMTATFSLSSGLDQPAKGALLVWADGVRSAVREAAGLGGSRFSGLVAWRAMAENPPESPASQNAVTAFLHPGVHLVAYPLRGGAVVNLVAVTKGSEHRSSNSDAGQLYAMLRGMAPDLKVLVEAAGSWSAWPLHVSRPKRWTDPRGLALIGDAAHAMTPFAAQGAAMAIEDAVVLADLMAADPHDLAAALARYEAARRPRLKRVARRGALNRLAWHASGPMALVRNAVLKMRSPESLAADMDWLYGWDVGGGGIS